MAILTTTFSKKPLPTYFLANATLRAIKDLTSVVDLRKVSKIRRLETKSYTSFYITISKDRTWLVFTTPCSTSVRIPDSTAVRQVEYLDKLALLTSHTATYVSRRVYLHSFTKCYTTAKPMKQTASRKSLKHSSSLPMAYMQGSQEYLSALQLQSP